MDEATTTDRGDKGDTDMKHTHLSQYIRAQTAVTKYVQGVQDKTRKSDSELYRSLQTQANQLRRQVYRG